ncbi:MAG: NFACT RNA binding domain-containing protein [Cytophagales bacterium]
MFQYSYYFLEKLSEKLNLYLSNFSFWGSISTSNHEIILIFKQDDEQFNWKITFEKSFFVFSFPHQIGEFQRPQKYGQELTGEKIESIATLSNERIIEIKFSKGSIRIKAFQQGTVYFLDNNQSQLSKFPYSATDFENFEPKPFSFTKEQWFAHPDLKSFWPFLSKSETTFLNKHNFNQEERETQWNLLQSLYEEIQHSKKSYLLEFPNLKIASVIGTENILEESYSPIELCQLIFRKLIIEDGFQKEKEILISQKKQTKIRIEKAIIKSEHHLFELKNNINYRSKGDLIMAHLHQLQKGIENFECNDFVTNEKLIIKMNPKLTPYENAENYYRKAKNHWREIETLEKTISSKKAQLETIESEIVELENLSDRKSLNKEKKKAEPVEEPFFRHQFEGWEIWVGKNAKKNDELTQKHAYKEDLWLHAKHTTGSHVIVKHQSGKKFPNHVIERAAEMAAYYSKSKNDTLASVIVTPKKFVRKPKGSAPGSVVVDKEEVVLVKPKP